MEKKFLTFGSGHLFPNRQVVAFAKNEVDAARMFSNVFKVRQGAYAFCYDEDEFDSTGMVKDVKAFLFQSWVDVQDVLAKFKPGTEITADVNGEMIKGVFAGIQSGFMKFEPYDFIPQGRSASVPFSDISAIIID